jgi:hypothetical protein
LFCGVTFAPGVNVGEPPPPPGALPTQSSVIKPPNADAEAAAEIAGAIINESSGHRYCFPVRQFDSPCAPHAQEL